ncbi:MAG: hypothetical protein GEU80_13440 [Dehalococcoidia bacterium]|nr:hypothetical protein [Dehalococcoidia bacterium]
MPDHPDRLGDAVRRLLAVRRPQAPRPAADDLPGRLDRLERDVQEVRTRINALFFAVLTAAAGDLVGRLVLG